MITLSYQISEKIAVFHFSETSFSKVIFNSLTLFSFKIHTQMSFWFLVFNSIFYKDCGTMEKCLIEKLLNIER